MRIRIQKPSECESNADPDPKHCGQLQYIFQGNLSPGARLLCGLGAGVSEAILAVTPMETVKVKFIADQRSSNPQFKVSNSLAH
jgi:hypothetical protein